MSEQKNILDYANKLERLLEKYLDCDYHDFGVKANGHLADEDWKSAINFALGYRYATSDKNEKMKDDINYFLGNELIGKNMSDLIHNYEHYAFDSKDAVYDYIEDTINKLENILFK